MPVPSSITDLSTSAGSNSPAGTDPIGTDADNYIRALAAFIAQLRDGSKNLEAGTATAPSLAFTGDTNTGIYSPGADGVSIVAGGAQRLYVGTTGATLPTGLILSFNNSNSDASANIVNSGGAGVSTLDFKTSSSARLSISNGGIITNPSNTQPSFRATNSASQSSGSSNLTTYTETYDQGGNFNNSTGVFVAPVAGVYLFVLDWQCSLSSSGQVEVQIYNSTTPLTLAYGEFSLGSAAGIIKQGAVVALARLAASDNVVARTGSVTNGTAYANSFSGHLLG